MKFNHSIIIDTDIGGDPDDTFAVLLSAFLNTDVRLVVTTDESNGERARFARHLLDLVNRRDIEICEGPNLGAAKSFVIDGMTPRTVPRQPQSVLPQIRRILRESLSLTWVGLGPMTNLANFLAVAQADELQRCKFYQMGGGLYSPPKAEAEHNFRLDPKSAAHVVTSIPSLSIVMAHSTFNPQAEILRDSAFFDRISKSSSPWAVLLTEQCRRWFERFYPGTIQHDPMTLAAALGKPFIRFSTKRIVVDSKGRTCVDEGGSEVQVSDSVDYCGAMKWIEEGLLERL